MVIVGTRAATGWIWSRKLIQMDAKPRAYERSPLTSSSDALPDSSSPKMRALVLREGLLSKPRTVRRK